MWYLVSLRRTKQCSGNDDVISTLFLLRSIPMSTVSRVWLHSECCAVSYVILLTHLFADCVSLSLSHNQREENAQYAPCIDEVLTDRHRLDPSFEYVVRSEITQARDAKPVCVNLLSVCGTQRVCVLCAYIRCARFALATMIDESRNRKRERERGSRVSVCARGHIRRARHGELAGECTRESKLRFKLNQRLP